MTQTPPAPHPDASEAPLYQAKERLYLTADMPPRLVKEGDPDAHQLFVAAGGYVPFQLARRYGLVAAPTEPAVDVPDEVEVAARLAPPATTARKGPRETKQGGD